MGSKATKVSDPVGAEASTGTDLKKVLAFPYGLC